MAFFAKSWAIPVCMYHTTFTTHFISAVCWCYLYANCSLLTMFKTFDCIDRHRLGCSSVGLVAVKIFHRHLVFFGVLK